MIQILIWIFVHIKILIQIYSDIRSCQKISYEYIRIFVCVIFLTRIYSDIRSYQNPYECHTLVASLIWEQCFDFPVPQHVCEIDTHLFETTCFLTLKFIVFDGTWNRHVFVTKYCHHTFASVLTSWKEKPDVKQKIKPLFVQIWRS